MLYPDIPRPDAPVIYTGVYPILRACQGRRSIYNTIKRKTNITKHVYGSFISVRKLSVFDRFKWEKMQRDNNTKNVNMKKCKRNSEAHEHKITLDRLRFFKN